MDLDKYNPNTNFLLYKTDNGDVKVDVLLKDKTIWMPQKNIAELFGVGVPAISKHLKNIFESGELNEKVVVSILEITTQHGAIADKQSRCNHCCWLSGEFTQGNPVQDLGNKNPSGVYH